MKSVDEELAPGVRGYTMEDNGELYIPVIISTERGKGHVGRYLDSLPTDRTVKVPNVMNPILSGMLLRRGFKVVAEWAGEPFHCWCSVWVREAKP